MDKVNFVEFEQNGEVVIHAIIDNGDGSFTSMPKDVYDAQLAQQTGGNLIGNN